jgi:hypothetical protein
MALLSDTWQETYSSASLGRWEMDTPKVAIVFGFFAYSGATMAAAQAPSAGPSWEIIAVGAVGFFVSAVGWYAKGVSDKVGHLEDKVSELNTVMLREYHPKADVKIMLDEIKASMNSLHAKFEKFEGLYGR